MQDPLRHFTAELIGTFALVFVGSGAILLSKAPGSTIGLVEIALAHGLIRSIMVTATMVLLSNLIADLLYAIADPRIRFR